MKYLCLRDCYVNDRFWSKGEVYELDVDMEKSEKNFKAVEAPEPEEPETGTTFASSSGAEAETQLPAKPKPDVIPDGLFWCGRCETLHRETSKVGQKHLKYKE